ncbi:MAG: AmmeMemoRadiSam system protein A [Candidatus Izemoplasmatales bacterium]|nr:AmmeMemoRadiSam system protein A [Candidatus Izemoplasmatales bacterium]
MPLVGAYIVPHPPIIIPNIGRGEELKIVNTINAYQQISREISEKKPDTIIISSPHFQGYYDYIKINSAKTIKGNLKNFGCDLSIEVESDIELVKSLEKTLLENDFPAGTSGKTNNDLDHGTFIPLYFINQAYQNYKLILVSLSGLSLKNHYDFGTLISETLSKSDKKIVYIASGDLSHKLKIDGPYGYAKEGVDFDKQFVKDIIDNNLNNLLSFDESFLRKAAECGLRSFTILAGVLSKYDYQSKLLSYEGTFGVGYAVVSFNIAGKKEISKKIDPYVHLAKSTLEEYVKTGKKLKKPTDLPKEMISEVAGVFVSLKKFGQLRGCIGTMLPTTNSIADEIIQNAISSGTRDPRFKPVSESELQFLEYSVDVLTKPILVNDINELNPKKYGVIVTYRNRNGLLLPDLDGVDNVSQQLQIALRKANISEEDNYSIEKFEVVRHS